MENFTMFIAIPLMFLAIVFLFFSVIPSKSYKYNDYGGVQ